MLSKAEIVQRLRIIRHSPRRERNARRAVSMNGTATAAGISREHLHRIVNGTRSPSLQLQAELSRVLTCDQNERARSGLLCPTEQLGERVLRPDRT